MQRQALTKIKTELHSPKNDEGHSLDQIIHRATLKARSYTTQLEESKLKLKRSSLFDSSKMSRIEQAPVAYNDA